MEIQSKEMIKPSSSTPQHLHKHNLSFLDQHAPQTYVDLVFFYESPTDSSSISQNLKKSLSQVLTMYYPLAGRIIIGQGTEPPYVDCNDTGVEFVETLVHTRMFDVITDDPNPDELQKYVCNIIEQASRETGITPLSIQSNLFDCGGVAVGLHISHKIADMASLAMFMNDWAATCRRQQHIGPRHGPDFNILSSHFPARSFVLPPPPPPQPDNVDAAQKVVTKRFVFGKEMLSELRRVGSSPDAMNSSKVEAVTAFLWGSYILAHKQTTNFAAFHAVNVRNRLMAPRGFGNGCTQAVAWWDDTTNTTNPALITIKLRGAIRRIDVGKMKDRDDDEYRFDKDDRSKGADVWIFSSWCRFPVYDVDYGWGKPHWVSTTSVPVRNLAVFMDTKDGDGIEAWVSMVETDIAMIDADYKRLCMQIMISS